MRECPSCGKKWYLGEKYCPACNRYIGGIPDVDQQIVYPKQEEKPIIECPYCHSTDTKKITATSRAVSISLFGISSKKLGKQFHCNRCKADF